MRKPLFIFLILLLSSVANTATFYNSEISDYGIIYDKEGYVNLRKSPNLSSPIIKKIKNGTLIYCYNEGGRINNFCYSQTPEGMGYIHTSRIKILNNDFKKIKHDGTYTLYNQRNTIYISHQVSSKYHSICIKDNINNQQTCIPPSKLKNLHDIDIESHVAYWDSKSGRIYLTASNGIEGHIYNIVWIIENNKNISRWIYDFNF